jgi:uncharacterized protein (TIGR03435 family)
MGDEITLGRGRMRLRSAIRASAVVALVLSWFNLADAQPTVQPKFDVASIKRVPPSDSSLPVSMSDEHGRINYTNVTLRGLIRKAYGLRIYPPSSPLDPLSTERYNIVAKASGDASGEQTMRMLQELLKERFKLVAHRETKELRVWALVAGKSGPKLREVQDDGSSAEIGSGDGHKIKAHHISMKLLANALQGWVGDPVTDETGLTGLFDVTLDFTVDENTPADREWGQTVFEAVQRQLGLKLEARKGPVEVVVIDHVEEPSSN